MKRLSQTKRAAPKEGKAVGLTHPLVGVWVEEEHPVYTTTVVFTIAAKEGGFLVSGVDESDGVELNILNVFWDGEELHFESLFPPTNHRAVHGFSLTRRAHAKHTVSFSDEDGDHTVTELWKKRS
jgi:hypothetical protein